MRSQSALGVIATFLAAFMWGVLPVYWKQMQSVPAVQILANRIIWSLLFTGLLAVLLNKWPHVKSVFAEKRQLKLVVLASSIITLNWGSYIWAVNNGHIVECGIGYYINPLVAAFLGVVIFKEKTNLLQKIAFLLAFIGVSILILQYGGIPWISLFLAGTFGIYSAIKKMLNLDVVAGIILETGFTAPFALMYLLFCQLNGNGAFWNLDLRGKLFLMGTGIITAVPLLCLAIAVQRVSMSTMGFIQYVNPTLNLLIGVLLYNEAFTSIHLTSLVFIWTGFIVFTLSQSGLWKKPLQKKRASDYR